MSKKWKGSVVSVEEASYLSCLNELLKSCIKCVIYLNWIIHALIGREEERSKATMLGYSSFQPPFYLMRYILEGAWDRSCESAHPSMSLVLSCCRGLQGQVQGKVISGISQSNFELIIPMCWHYNLTRGARSFSGLLDFDKHRWRNFSWWRDRHEQMHR